MSTESVCAYPCADGPLRGELHDHGPQFVFDGRLAGLDRGFYSLENGEYRWHSDRQKRPTQKP